MRQRATSQRASQQKEECSREHYSVHCKSTTHTHLHHFRSQHWQLVRQHPTLDCLQKYSNTARSLEQREHPREQECLHGER